MPDDAHIVAVDTLTYSGVWIEGKLSAAALRAARSLSYRQEWSSAGTLIPVDDVTTLEAARQADYMQVGEFDWWERSTADAV